MTTIGFVRIFFTLAAYLRVFSVSLPLDRAGETQAIWKFRTPIKSRITRKSNRAELLRVYLPSMQRRCPPSYRREVSSAYCPGTECGRPCVSHRSARICSSLCERTVTLKATQLVYINLDEVLSDPLFPPWQSITSETLTSRKKVPALSARRANDCDRSIATVCLHN